MTSGAFLSIFESNQNQITMKKTNFYSTAALLAIFALLFGSCVHISAELDVPSGGILEDAILIVSDNGDVPRDAFKLGDIDLSASIVTFAHSVDTNTYTHWWLIGSMGGNVVYSSVLSLTGVDMYTIDPYTGAELAWNIPNNLDAFVNGTTYSLDWWAQTVNNHNSHVAANKNSASLWSFNNGSFLGSIHIDLRTN